MRLNKRIALAITGTLCLVGVMGAAGAADQRERPAERPRAASSIEVRKPYHLYNRSAHLFMLAKSWNKNKNGPVDIWHEHKNKNDANRLQEQWKFLPTGEKWVLRIENVGSGLCLQPDKQDAWRRVRQQTCDKYERDQWWRVHRTEGGLRISSYTNPNQVLSPHRNASPAHDVVLYRDVRSLSQRWSAMPVE